MVLARAMWYYNTLWYCNTLGTTPSHIWGGAKLGATLGLMSLSGALPLWVIMPGVDSLILLARPPMGAGCDQGNECQPNTN